MSCFGDSRRLYVLTCPHMHILVLCFCVPNMNFLQAKHKELVAQHL
jgi:hypothetical protein